MSLDTNATDGALPANQFDRRVEVRDPKTGQVIRHQPYKAYHIGSQVILERPTGKFWYENNEPAPHPDTIRNPGAVVTEAKVEKKVETATLVKK